MLALAALLVALTGLVVVANLGETRPAWWAITYIAGATMGLGMGILGLLSLLLAFALRRAPQAFLPEQAVALGNLGRVSLGIWLSAGGVSACLVLLPTVRRGLARVLPIRPGSSVNALALVLLIVFLVQSLGLSGLKPQDLRGLLGELSVAQVVASEAVFGIVAVAGVGFLTRRTPRETWERLGLGGLTWRQLGLTLAGVVGLLVLEVVAGAIAMRISPPAYGELSGTTETLYAGLTAPLAALVVALASGTAEEILFRGALQPRFGLLLTSLAFGVVHVQYGLVWALLSTGTTGLVLGVYRQRINTTACILLHGLYNLTLLLVAGLG